VKREMTSVLEVCMRLLSWLLLFFVLEHYWPAYSAPFWICRMANASGNLTYCFANAVWCCTVWFEKSYLVITQSLCKPKQTISKRY
jgi:hypothetical protein